MKLQIEDEKTLRLRYKYLREQQHKAAREGNQLTELICYHRAEELAEVLSMRPTGQRKRSAHVGDA